MSFDHVMSISEQTGGEMPPVCFYYAKVIRFPSEEGR